MDDLCVWDGRVDRARSSETVVSPSGPGISENDCIVFVMVAVSIARSHIPPTTSRSKVRGARRPTHPALLTSPLLR